MALQTSGAISLNDIHVEAGGSSGSQASINDADIRGLIGKNSGSQMSFNEWYGASAGIFQNTVNLTFVRNTTGTTDFKGNFTPNGYSYGLTIQNWSSLSPANRLGKFSSTDTSVPTSGLNPMGAISGTTYDTMSWSFSQATSLSGVVGTRSMNMNFWDNNRTGSVYPVWGGNTTSQPTAWTSLNLTFTYAGTNYNWTWTRASHVSAWTASDFTFGGPVSQGYYVMYFDSSHIGAFTPSNTGTAVTITGAKFTLS